MLKFANIYKDSGLERSSQLTSPKVISVRDLKLPEESTYHHNDYDAVMLGPRSDTVALAGTDLRVMIDHVTALHSPKGRPLKDPKNDPNKLITEYTTTHKKYQRIRNMDTALRSRGTLIVYNYNILAKAFKYTTSRFSKYHLWSNILKTTYSHMNSVMRNDNRHHFVMLELPRRIPNTRLLRHLEKDIETLPENQRNLVSKPEYMRLLDFWTWLGPNRQASMMSAIDQANHHKVTIILQYGDKCTLINLDKLQGLLGNDADDDSVVDNGNDEMRRKMYRFILSVIDEAKESTSDDNLEKQSVKNTVPTDDDDDSINSKEAIAEDDAEAKALIEVEDSVADDDSSMERAAQHEEMDRDPRKAYIKKATALANEGRIGAAQLNRATKLAERTANLPNPYGDGLLVDHAVIEKEDNLIPKEDVQFVEDIKGVPDKSMLKSKVDAANNHYNKKLLTRDIARVVLDLQRSGYSISKYDVQEVNLYGGDFIETKIQVTPIEGDTSTLVWRYPKIDKDGNFTADGVKYRMKMQRGDLPIRKVSPSRVALESYHAKLFVERSTRAVVNYPASLEKEILAKELAGDLKLDDQKPIDVFRHKADVPRIYSIMAKMYAEFKHNGIHYMFDYNQYEKVFDADAIKYTSKKGFTLVGSGKGKLVVVGDDNVFYMISNPSKGTYGKTTEPMGYIEDVLGLDTSKTNIEVAEFQLYSKSVPVGFALGYTMGLNTLIRRLNINVRKVSAGSRLDLQPNEYAIKFQDETLIIDKRDPMATLVIGGFNRYHKEIKQYPLNSFHGRDVYMNIMEDNGLRVGFMRELDLAMERFVDPITRDILIDMGEPTELDALLMRACELLKTDFSPEENARLSQRERGYERFAGHLYEELSKAVRLHRSRGVGGVNKLEMNPQALWMNILQDSSVGIVEEINPIRDLKHKEESTVSGHGGRSARSMVKRTRSFTHEDMGLTSESTTDSSTVGINVGLPPNPNLANVRGIGEKFDYDNYDNSSILSSAALTAPGADHDDMKRIVFIPIQHNHGVATVGAMPSPYATGYDTVMAHRVSDIYAKAAEQDGKVLEVGDNYAVFKYKDGTEDRVEIGRRYGKVPDGLVPHDIVCDLPKGRTFKKGEVLTYNSGFFVRNSLDKTQVLWRMGVFANTMLIEAPNTYEDSCEVSEKIAEMFETTTSNYRDVIVDYDHEVHNLVKLGDKVSSDDILCILRPTAADAAGVFTEASEELLWKLSADAPKAGVGGTIEKMEVLYHGDIENMSESLKKLAIKSDKEMKARCKALGKPVITGNIGDTMRIGAKPLNHNQAAIRIYSSKKLSAGEGDKGVFANQSKTVISNIMVGETVTEYGDVIDAKFSWRSFANRMVESPKLIGGMCTLLMLQSKMVYNFHKTGKKGVKK